MNVVIITKILNFISKSYLNVFSKCVKYYMLNIIFITRYPYVSSLVILISIHSTTRFPYSLLKSTFIDTDKAGFLTIFFWSKRHYNTSARYIKFIGGNSNDQSAGQWPYTFF